MLCSLQVIASDCEVKRMIECEAQFGGDGLEAY
jgi:hypothetical protein